MYNEYEKMIELIEDKRYKCKLNEKTLDYFKSLDIFDSLHIEGNTLTREAVTVFLESGVTVHGKQFKEFMEVHNYNQALELLKINLVDEKFQLTPMFIKQLHRTVSKEILDEDQCGKYRNDYVFLRGTTYVPPHWEDVPELVQNLCDYYNNWSIYDKGESRFENIISTFRKLESTHPFADGNGRTGRLMMNYLLLNNGYPFLWIDSKCRAEYLACFSSMETCKEFHAKKMIEMYNFLEKYTKNERDSRSKSVALKKERMKEISNSKAFSKDEKSTEWTKE